MQIAFGIEQQNRTVRDAFQRGLEAGKEDRRARLISVFRNCKPSIIRSEQDYSLPETERAFRKLFRIGYLRGYYNDHLVAVGGR
jgi:hypothetical protein